MAGHGHRALPLRFLCTAKEVIMKLKAPHKHKEMNHIVLPKALSKDDKMKILCQVYNVVEQMIMHFDTLRQRNLNLAVVIFAGLCGLAVKLGSDVNQEVIPLAIMGIMLIFFLIDRKYHVYSHGFQGSSYQLIHKMAEVYNGNAIEFDKYDYSYAKTAEWFSLQAIVYYFLIAAAALSYFILPHIRIVVNS